jgi:hypothetical protein
MRGFFLLYFGYMSSDGHGGGGGLPFLGALNNFLHSAQSDRSVHITARQLIIAFLVMIGIFFIISPSQSLNDFNVLFVLSPIWLSILLARFVIAQYVHAKRAEFIANQEYVLLELRIPRDNNKSPRAMEAFFSSMHIGTGETTWWKKYVLGNTRAWWSLEIASLGGRIHFYIWTRVGFRRLVESYLYSQYPGLEIIEAEDYSRIGDLTDHNHDLWGGEYVLRKPDPYPIKTYVDYDMKPGDKPEETTDPLAQILELMGSLGPNEQMWLQFIVRQSKMEKFDKQKDKDGKPLTFQTQAKELINDLRDSVTRKNKQVNPVTGEVFETQGFPNPSKGITETIAAIERKASKQAFDVGIRCIYGGTKEAFQGIMVTAQINMFKPFNDETRNYFGLAGVFGGSFNDYPWEDVGGHHREHLKHEVYRMYRYRSYFYDPYTGPWNILDTEELATLFHIPSAAVTTPNLERIQSATSGAPPNLPV